MAHRLYGNVASRARCHCEYCFAPEAFSNQEFEVDHIFPAERGGQDVLENLALACRSCNGRKGTATQARDPGASGLVQLFNPRLDVWDDHFELDVLEGSIRGKTVVGRATVIRLGMSRPKAIRARFLWLFTLRMMGALD